MHLQRNFTSFNSIKVQLRQNTIMGFFSKLIFQFHKGTIKAVKNSLKC